MSRLSARHSTIARKEIKGCSCETCGRPFESPIQLTNLAASPTEVYNVCPFCFSKQTESLEKVADLNTSALGEPSEAFEKNDRDQESAEQSECPHFVGYLKKRPKKSPIPDDCLTCRKMIQCLL